ncbi:hypothetical protein CCMA1212_005889 [Trichoderma ghanense]|uniref:Uncharacterized protein n=1 Tax=Trichoderma ghanense TaxID=65468 RepID=A0ABY2H2K8_9HYPO
MSGRRRRASTSSVETVDGDRIHWMKETSVVRSQPKDAPKDLYPCFELRDATVYDMNGESLENALNVVVRGPYIVRGHLVIDDISQTSYLIAKVRGSAPIEIRHCISYSIGEDEARPVVWVLGRGGWYEINPSEAYRPIFNKMCEATTMYYSLVDIYTSEKFSRPPVRANANALEALRDDFLQYAMKVGDGATFNEVVQRCAEHAIFFVCQFGQESLELIDWKQTRFHRWFTAQHADVVRETELALKNPRKPVSPARDVASPAPSHRLSTRNTRSLSIEIDADTVQLSKRPKPSPLADVASPGAAAQRPAIPTLSAEATMSPAANDESPFASVHNAIERLYEERRGAKKGITATNAANGLYFHYKFPNYKDGSPGSHRVPVEEVLHYYAAALLQTLDRAKYQPHGLYTYLEELAAKPFSPRALKPSDFPYRLEPRKTIVRASKKVALGSGDPESSPRDDGTPGSSDPPRHAGKTVKRPGRQPGKTSALRISAYKKRTFADIGDESEPDSEASGVKRSHYFSDRDDEEEEEDVSMQDSADAGASRDAGLVVQPPSEDAEPIQILIRAEKIPSTMPRGPDDTWTCDQDGCAYIVRGGDAHACQVRIQRHFEEHDEQSKRLNLAVTESTRGHMPIKYAYFPPFLILAEMPPANETTTMTSPPPPPARTSYPSPEPDAVPVGIPNGLPGDPTDDPPDDAPDVVPDLSGSATESFRQLVAQFRRRPQPVSDRIPSLTLLQSSSREAQANGRKGAAGPAVADPGRNAPVPNQEETDSMTLRLDDDDYSDDDYILISSSRCTQPV